MQILKIILIVFTIFITVVLLSWSIIEKNYLLDTVHLGIKNGINERIENDFEFTLDNLKINWFSNRIQLKGVNLLVLNKKDTVGFFKGDVGIDIDNWINLLFVEQKLIKNIDVRKAQLYFASDNPIKIKERLNNQGSKVEIANASAQGNLILAERHGERSGRLVTNFNLSTALNYKSREVFKSELLLKKVFALNLSRVHYYLKEGFYQIKIDEVALRGHNDIILKKIVFNPINSRKIFATKKIVATDYISVALDSIHLVDLDRQRPDQFILDRIQFYQPSIDVYRDNNFPDSKEFKEVLVDLLNRIETPVYIREMSLKNMYIKYSELANDGESAGELFFSDANAKISNITNIKDSVQLDNKMMISANAKFYGIGLLETSMEYELLSSSGQFNISGNLGTFDIVDANRIVSKLAPVKIESGQLNKLSFNFWGSNTHASGEMWFEYTDLKLEVTDVKYLNSNFTYNVLSLLGNKIMVNSNPSKKGTFRVGKIDQDRNTTKAMFHYWWISLRSGFLSSIGLSDEKTKIKYSTGEKATFFDKLGLGGE